MKRLVLMPVIIVCLILTGCFYSNDTKYEIENELLATPDTPQVSFDNKYELKVQAVFEDEVRHYRFLVYGNNGILIYKCEDIFRTRDTLYIAWDKDNRVWVYSGDLGVFVWGEDDIGKWVKKTYADKNPISGVPEVFRDLRPSEWDE